MRRVKIAAVVGLGLLAFGLTARVGEGARLPPRPKAAEEIPLGVQGNYTGTLTRPGQAPSRRAPRSLATLARMSPSRWLPAKARPR